MFYNKNRGRGGKPFLGSESSEEEELMGDRRDASNKSVLKILSDLAKGHNEVAQRQKSMGK